MRSRSAATASAQSGEGTGPGRMSETAFTLTYAVLAFPSSTERTSAYSPVRSVPR
jgi:hypothetical protein